MSVDVVLGHDSAESGEPKKSAADRVVELALERYEFGSTEEGDAFALDANVGHVVRTLKGGKVSLRAELAALYRTKHGKVPSAQALADALMVLEGEAQSTDATQVHLRVGAHTDGSVWLDLGDQEERAVRLSPQGWRIETFDVPVRFRRTKLTGALPCPVTGGTLDELWELLNVTEADRPLVLAWLIAALIAPSIPHPVLALFGEQGTGKSSACRLLVSLVDPSPVPLRKPPKDPDGWVTAASGSWVVGLDNLSDVKEWFSDSLCRAVTGDGDVRRALYTDGGLAVFSFRRCVLVNGIDLGALRGDLADRTIVVNLDRLAENQRRTETELNERFQAAWPRIVGALLSEACRVLAALSTVRLSTSPRMADFARILSAVDRLLGTRGLDRYEAQSRTLAADTLEGEPFIVVLRDMLTEPFEGSAADLLRAVTPTVDSWRKPQGWPKDARTVTGMLKRHAPALRKAGYQVEQLGRLARANVTGWRVAPPEGRGVQVHQLHQSDSGLPLERSVVSGNGGEGGLISPASQSVLGASIDDGRCRDRSHTPRSDGEGSCICRDCGKEVAA